jgi:hypothetical protein
MKKESLPDDIIWHQSGINLKGEPFVQLLRGTSIIGQMTPQEARDHARAVLEATEAAEQDAFLWKFAHEKLGCADQAAMGLIIEFRKFRGETTGKSQGPTRSSDWVWPPVDPTKK